MRLADLSPEWLHTTADGTHVVPRREDANGLKFLCPRCWKEQGSTPIGVHSIICHDLSVLLSNGMAGPGRWALEGASFDELSLVAGSSSILLTGGCGAHFFIERGDVRMA